MEDTINAVRSYLASEFPGTLIQRAPEADSGIKTKLEFDYIATMFLVGEIDHVLYVSDVVLYDTSAREVGSLLRRFDVAKELRQVGRLPLLVTTGGPLLLLNWLGPHELTLNETLTHAPNKGGVYLLVEPLEAGRWKPYFVDRHEDLSSHLQLFAQTKELGRVRCFCCAAIETGVLMAESVRGRVVKFMAEAYKIDDPLESDLPPLAVNVPPQLTI